MITRTGDAAAITSGHDGFLINRNILSVDYICVGFLSRNDMVHIVNVFILIQTFAEPHPFRDI
jgi:uncharacterized cupin superfamily protein